MFRRKQPHNPATPGAPFPPGPDPRGIRRRRRAPRRSRWLYFFAFIGAAAVCFLLIRWLLIPLLVALA